MHAWMSKPTNAGPACAAKWCNSNLLLPYCHQLGLQRTVMRASTPVPLALISLPHSHPASQPSLLSCTGPACTAPSRPTFQLSPAPHQHSLPVQGPPTD